MHNIAIGFYTFQAHDGDEADTKNSEITYSIINVTVEHFNNNNITVNGTTGALRLLHALDYEKINSDTITVTVMAKDGGTPPLNSTAVVKINVQVCSS